MRHLIIIAVCLAGGTLPCLAQKFVPALSMGEIGVSVGMYTNVDREVLGEGTAYSVDYGEFNLFSGLGFRGGISYIEGLDMDIDAVSLPLKFAWRTPLPRRMTALERLESAILSQMGHYRPNVRDALLSQIPIRFEINAGITPGYVSGSGFYAQRYTSSEGWFDYGVSVKRRFMLTADAGARLSIRIWRFNIVFNGQYHYLITNNYRKNTTSRSFAGELSRSYFSLNLGLGLML